MIPMEIDSATGAAMVPLSGKKFSGEFALVNPEDFLEVAQYSWHGLEVTKGRSGRPLVYAASKAVLRLTGSQYLHRYLLGVTDPQVKVDHENHNGLDCRRINLRLTTNQQNQFNRRSNVGSTSQFKGVHWDPRKKRWRVRPKINGKYVHIGNFTDEVEAARAYDEAVANFQREFSNPNFSH